ncbi:MAG: DUF1491 family protein [Pseudomonadota bacterium]
MARGFDIAASPRLKAEIWVGAYLRRCTSAGAFAALSRRGDASAGAIFIEVIHDKGCDLWAPAPLAAHRAFECVLQDVDPLAVTERLENEQKFDPDLWIVTLEDRAGRAFLEDDERG